MVNEGSRQRRAFKSFLSHRYQSPQVNLPPYLSNIHYLRYWTYPRAAQAAAAIVDAFDKGRTLPPVD